MALYHTHVYAVTALYETDVEADTDKEAEDIAMKLSEKSTEWKKSDKDKLVFVFKERYRKVLCD